MWTPVVCMFKSGRGKPPLQLPMRFPFVRSSPKRSNSEIRNIEKLGGIAPCTKSLSDL